MTAVTAALEGLLCVWYIQYIYWYHSCIFHRIHLLLSTWNLSNCQWVWFLYKRDSYTPCPKISGTPVSNTPNLVRSSWISTTYCTLHYLNITHYNNNNNNNLTCKAPVCAKKTSVALWLTHFTVCAQCNFIMTSEFVYITVIFNTLLLTKGSSSSIPALD